MNTYIPLILTTIVTISTIIYTICSIELWRTTRAAAEISRQAAFSNLWAELNRYLEILRQHIAKSQAFRNSGFPFTACSLVPARSMFSQRFSRSPH